MRLSVWNITVKNNSRMSDQASDRITRRQFSSSITDMYANNEDAPIASIEFTFW